MLGEDRVMDIIKTALSFSESEQLEVMVYGSNVALTRYASSYIHQNVSYSVASISIRAVEGKRWGVASTDDLSNDAIKNTVRIAREIALSREEDPDFESLPRPAEYKKVNVFRDACEKQSPIERAEAVKEIIGEVKKGGFEAAGSYRVETTEVGIGNSLGVRCYHPLSKALLVVVSISDTSEGYADACGLEPADIDHLKVAVESADVCGRAQNPKDIEPGNYDVILTPYAIGELMSWMTFVGFSAKMYDEGRSFMTDRMGEKIFGDNITFIDDGLTDRNFAFPFDFEGVPRERVVLVDNGVAEAVCVDSVYARKLKVKNTGHSLPKGEEVDAIPLHLQIEPGDSTPDDMVSRVNKGLYVSNFHYVNGFIDPRNAIFTGMTRYGLFYIEDGKIKYPVKNLRFTESMLKAFSNVASISRERKLISYYIGGFLLPYLLVNDFKFTSKTSH
ncbi:MAG: hypothetical protein B6D57_03980 [Candidatus Coatesbacteria bacterium 4484_99]|uniref:TldD/PmbA family protein n=1 Tax=Candidatus Coatesbacteria bacterium 4484_99 TaxID=1970774 RepID=A0A1W9S0L7_9BACT|nr:MAG: hypothetical protein B6D57_03980 [Candidatus Coatesbacteria bacterium 4484_99]RLC40564.1 MAG: hypothetical protein DRH49_06905 [Candidatus Coatesbacteria bacterium]